MEASDQIKRKACDLGFELVGIAPAKPTPDLDFFRWWLDRGYAGTMDYLRRGAEKRGDPGKILPGVRSAICCGINYYAPESSGVPISRYAQGEDYHRVVQGRLQELVDFIQKEIDPESKNKVYVDTGPILERSYAARAGLGWIGKNTCLINNGVGSFVFLGEILTTLKLEPDQPGLDQCGSCTKCLEACPTGAFVEPYVMDANKCISYLTIEYRGDFTTEEAGSIGPHVYGCDICQEVCPYNDMNQPTSLKEFYPRKGLISPSIQELEEISEQKFKGLRKGSAMERIGWRQWRRNLKSVKNVDDH